jgi:hypothetical protein
VNDQYKALSTRVTIACLSDSGMIISNGLKDGDKIVTDGQNKVKDGQTVSFQ